MLEVLFVEEDIHRFKANFFYVRRDKDNTLNFLQKLYFYNGIYTSIMVYEQRDRLPGFGAIWFKYRSVRSNDF